MDDNNFKDTARDGDNKDKIYWHDAFFAALRLELHEYKHCLTFEDEHQLSKEALKMDVLVIKKNADIKIEKNIGLIFMGHNIFEYKSDKDNLSVWDYNKVCGYAMIYSAFNKIPTDDITISFVVTPKPVKLLKHLSAKGFQITENPAGIHIIEGDTFKTQIIENKRLSEKENVFLKNLRGSLTRKDIQDILDAYRKYGELEKVSAYLSRIIEANKPVFKEVLAMKEETVEDIVYNHFKERGYLDKIKGEGRVEGRVEGTEEAKRETALEMLKDGFAPEKIARYVRKPPEWVQGLA